MVNTAVARENLGWWWTDPMPTVPEHWGRKGEHLQETVPYIPGAKI